MKELIQNIEQWASDRNIIKGSTPLDQSMKLFSEFGELADNVGKGRDCRDDIGDVFVVLTIMAKQTESDIDVLKLPILENLSVKQYVLELGYALHNFSFECDTTGDTNDSLGVAIAGLNRIANLFNYTLEECVQIAYDDISERKGLMHNGVFVKEDDEAYASIIKSIESNCE